MYLQALWRGALVRMHYARLKQSYVLLFKEIEDKDESHIKWHSRLLHLQTIPTKKKVVVKTKSKAVDQAPDANQQPERAVSSNNAISDKQENDDITTSNRDDCFIQQQQQQQHPQQQPQQQPKDSDKLEASTSLACKESDTVSYGIRTKCTDGDSYPCLDLNIPTRDNELANKDSIESVDAQHVNAPSNAVKVNDNGANAKEDRVIYQSSVWDSVSSLDMSDEIEQYKSKFIMSLAVFIFMFERVIESTSYIPVFHCCHTVKIISNDIFQ